MHTLSPASLAKGMAKEAVNTRAARPYSLAASRSSTPCSTLYLVGVSPMGRVAMG